MNLTDNTIFIPGGTSGLGLALATRLQDRGNTVIVGGRRENVLAELADEHGFGTVRIDTADPESIRTATADVIARYPELNVVVAMAGIMAAEDWHRAEGFLDTAESIVTTNLLGPIRLIAALTEHLQSRPDAAIVTVSSGLAFVPLQFTPTYNATKAAIHMLSESIRLQLADTSVEVHEIVPPKVATDLMPGQADEADSMPLDDWADETVANWADAESGGEVLTERVKFLRDADRRGEYAKVRAVLNGHS